MYDKVCCSLYALGYKYNITHLNDRYISVFERNVQVYVHMCTACVCVYTNYFDTCLN
jgi:hypothetical protein